MKENQSGKTKTPVAIPQAQQEYLFRLKKAHYAPLITYNKDNRLDEARILLQKRIAANLAPLILAGFDTKYDIFPERFSLEDRGENSCGQLRLRLLQTLQERLFPGGILRSRSLFDYCSIFARLCIDRYQCDVSLLADIINQHLHVLNRGFKLKYSPENNDILVITGDIILGLLFDESSKLSDLDPVHDYQLKLKLSMIFCALSEAIVFYYYELVLKKFLTRKFYELDDQESVKRMKVETDNPSRLFGQAHDNSSFEVESSQTRLSQFD